MDLGHISVSISGDLVNAASSIRTRSYSRPRPASFVVVGNPEVDLAAVLQQQALFLAAKAFLQWEQDFFELVVDLLILTIFSSEDAHPAAEPISIPGRLNGAVEYVTAALESMKVLPHRLPQRTALSG